MQTSLVLKKQYRFYTLVGLAMAGIFLVFVYGYFLQDTARIGLAQNEVTAEMSDLREDISEAETAYADAVGSVTRDQAQRFGFATVDKTRYISRKAPATLVSYRTDE